MPSYFVLLAAGGALILLVAWLPVALKNRPLSLPIVCVGIGAVTFAIAGGDAPDPRRDAGLIERCTELIVIVALTGAGLKLDRPLGWRRWALTWRLLGIGMPLSIAGIGLVGWGVVGLAPAAALLLGAALAPTDPVLASDVQVGPPRSGEEDEVRFTLTAEAGLNDGLAFPFVNLAIAWIAASGLEPAAAFDWRLEWLAVDVVWKLGVGIVLGYGIGRGLGWLMFRLPDDSSLSGTGEGFVAIGATLLAYALTEIAHGYGFLAVFVAALTLRAAERGHDFHDRLHEFSDQFERLLMMALLVLFGGALAGGVLAPLGWAGAAAAALIVLGVRPVAGLAALVGARAPLRERAAIAFFGIRGLGSVYYLAYAGAALALPEFEILWAVLAATILLSIVLHGVTVTWAMRALDRRR